MFQGVSRRVRFLVVGVIGVLGASVVGFFAVQYVPGHQPALIGESSSLPPSATNKLSPLQVTQLQKLADTELPSPVTEAKKLSSAGIQVIVDGVSVQPRGLAQLMNGLETTGVQTQISKIMQSSPSVSANTILRKAVSSVATRLNVYLSNAIATSVLNQMLWDKAIATKSVVPYATAKARAESNYQQYVNDGSPVLSDINTAETAKQTFISPGAIKGLQQGLTILEMKNVIAGPQYAKAGGVNNQGPALANWMSRELGRFRIVITNSPIVVSQLPGSLPTIL
jgi:hypothetical protein